MNTLRKSPSFTYKASDGAPKDLPPDLTRKEEITIHQLRTGKSPLAAHCLTKLRYKGLPDNEGKCLAGYDVMETVEHLLNCPMYGRQRQSVFGHDNITKDLNTEPEKILEFLKKIKRMTAPEL